MQPSKAPSPPASPPITELPPPVISKAAAKGVSLPVAQMAELTIEEPISHKIELLLTSATLQECEVSLKNIPSERRAEIRARLVELVKQPQEAAFPSPKSPPSERAGSLERITSFFSSDRKSVTSPPKARAVSPPRVDNEATRGLSPHRERELNPPPLQRNALSPRRDDRTSSPPPADRKVDMAAKSSEAEIERPTSPLRTRLIEPVRLQRSDLTQEHLVRAQELITLIDRLQLAKRNQYLLHAIEVNNCHPGARKGEEVPIWNLLALSNESIIKTDQLFELVSNYLCKERKEPLLSRRCETFLAFCSVWLESNFQTMLCEQARPHLQKIVTFGKSQTDPACKEKFLRIEQLLAPQEAPQARAKLSRCFSVSLTDFSTIIDNISGGTLDKSYVVFAEMVSIDLFLQFRDLTGKITPHDLIAKWTPKHGKAVEDYTRFFNTFSAFLTDMLLRRHLDAHRRACIAKFFVHIAFTSAWLGDLTTPMIISSALSHSSLNKLQCMRKLLESDQFEINFLEAKTREYVPRYVSTRQAIANLEDTFTSVRNSMKLRHLQEIFKAGKSCFIPYIPLLMKDLTFGGENASVQAANNSYNYFKLRLLSSKIEEQLSYRGKPLPLQVSYEVFQTDLLSRVFKESDSNIGHFVYHDPIDEETRYQTARDCDLDDAKKATK